MVKGYKKELNFIKQIHQTKSLFYWTGKFEGKKFTSTRAPFRNMEEIIDIEFYLLSSILHHAWVLFYLLSE